MPTTAGAVKGGKASSRNGIINKRSTEAKGKMDDRKFDPLEEAMDLALGKSSDYVHPYAKKHQKEIDKLKDQWRPDRLAYGPKIAPILRP